MGFLDSFLVFIAICFVPYYSTGIVVWLVGSMGLGMMNEVVASYMVPFGLNWTINSVSNLIHFFMNCKGTRITSITGIIMGSILPGLITVFFSFVLNMVPILKLPLGIFSFVGSILGITWVLELIINVIGNYILSFPSTLAGRVIRLKTGCKKSKEKKSKKKK